MPFFDVRIAGLSMAVVAAEGQNVQPVETDEFRIGVAEMYDVTVESTVRAHTIFAQSRDYSDYTRGTLAVREGLEADVPAMYSRPERGMASMGMAHGAMSTWIKGRWVMRMRRTARPRWITTPWTRRGWATVRWGHDATDSGS